MQSWPAGGVLPAQNAWCRVKQPCHTARLTQQFFSLPGAIWSNGDILELLAQDDKVSTGLETSATCISCSFPQVELLSHLQTDRRSPVLCLCGP